MRREEACLLLGVQDTEEDVIIDAYNQKAFEIRNFVFRTTLIPLLAKRRCEQLLKLYQALKVLTSDSIHEELFSQPLEQQKGNYESDFENFSVDTIRVLTLSEAEHWFQLESNYSATNVIAAFRTKVSPIETIVF